MNYVRNFSTVASLKISIYNFYIRFGLLILVFRKDVCARPTAALMVDGNLIIMLVLICANSAKEKWLRLLIKSFDDVLEFVSGSQPTQPVR